MRRGDGGKEPRREHSAATAVRGGDEVKAAERSVRIAAAFETLRLCMAAYLKSRVIHS